MADLKLKIIALENAAAECELISQLTPSKEIRLLHVGLAADYLRVANDLKHPALVAREARVKTGRKLVARQRGIIARLEQQGHTTGKAREFLALLEETLVLMERHLDRPSPADTPGRSAWRVGYRVTKINSPQLGTVVAVDAPAGKIKVKWDNGATSYYSHDQRADIRLVE